MSDELPRAAWFGSARDAATALLRATARAGDHVVCGRALDGAARLGLDVTLVDPRHPRRLRAAIGPRTRLVLVEACGIDLGELARAVVGTPALLAVEDALPEPALPDPLAQGADVVVYRATGLGNGVGGALLTNDPDLHARLCGVTDLRRPRFRPRGSSAYARTRR
jgi:O-succinylhomoserine sulfhydrylase